MSKRFIVSVVIVGYLCSIFVLLWMRRPGTGDVMPCAELTDAGNLVLAQEGKWGSILYEIDAAGHIVRAYGPVLHLAGFDTTGDGRLLMITQKNGAGTSEITVSRVNEAWSGAQILGTMEYGNQLSVTSSSVADGRLYVTALDQVEGRAVLYSCDYTGEEGAGLQEEMRRDLSVSHKVVDASWDGTHLYILLCNGELGYYTRDSYRFFPAGITERVMWMEASSGGLLYTTVAQSGVWFLENAVSRCLGELDTAGLLDADCLKGGEQAAALVRDRDYVHRVAWCESGDFLVCGDFAGSLGIRWQISQRAAAVIGIFWFLTGVFLFCFRMRRRRFRPVIRAMVMGMVVINAMFIALLTIYIYRHSRGYLEESRAVSNQVFGVMETDQLETVMGVSLRHVKETDFYDTEWSDGVDMALRGVMVEENGRIIDFASDLVYADADRAVILNSWDCVTGRAMYAQYDRELSALFEEARMAEDGQAVGKCRIRGRPFQICIGRAGGENLYYVRKASLSDLDERSHAMWGNSLRWACIYGVIFTILNIVILYHYMRPVRTAAEYMNRVAGGVYELPQIRFPDNELGRIWVALHRMCKALQEQEYARQNVVKYYARFAPQGFEKLFDQKSLRQVAVGDFVTVQATVGIVSLTGRESVLRSGTAGEYIRYSASLLECIGKCNEEEGGILLPDGNTPESVKVIYREPELTAGQAVGFGVASVRRLEEWKDGRYEMSPQVLLHSGSCLCGLAGTVTQTRPVIISQELELLSPCGKWLREMGIHVAITGQTKERQKNRFTTRYIGSVTPGDGQRFELYEVLEACSGKEQRRKKELAGLFSQALTRYEQGDFEEARTAFLEIVKTSPQDQAARWYLFSSEEKLSPKIPAADDRAAGDR